MSSNDSQRFIASHVIGLPRSGIHDFFAIVAAMPQAISLGIGEPDFVIPWNIREAAIFALEKGKTSEVIALIEILRGLISNNFSLLSLFPRICSRGLCLALPVVPTCLSR